MKKKILLLVITLLSTMTASANEAMADGIYYDLDVSAKTATVTSGYTKYTGSVTIPATVTLFSVTYSVTAIGDLAFLNCSDLTSINIPNSVTSIGRLAFGNCSGLTSVTIGNSVTSIGDRAFSGCSGLSTITIPNSVTSIGESAFYGCSTLSSITIPNSVTSIGTCAFYGCSGLTSVIIGNSVTSIEPSVFSNCSNLTSVTIGYNVASIKDGAFWGCSSLTSIELPYIVTSIGDYAFYNCSSLTSIEIPINVTSIGSSAFNGCSGLTSVTIPNSVTSIGDYAFIGCSSLTSVTIPNSVTSIGDRAFSGCSDLSTITIPNSVTSIGSSAFYGTAWYNNKPDGLVYAGLVAYKYKGTMPDNTNIIIEDGTTGIASYAFQNCYGLKSITIPNSVTSIGDYAFQDCYGLKSITIPNSVTSIGKSVFYGSSNLSIVVANGNTTYDSRNNCNAIIETATNTLVAGCGYTKIPNSVTSIGDYAFNGCVMSSITIPNSVTSIGNSAFQSCSSLSSITIPNSVTSIGSSAFYGTLWYNNKPNGLVYAGRIAYIYKGTMPKNTSITIEEGTLVIAPSVFSSCSGLTSITIPNSVTEIGKRAFEDCSGLTSVTIPNSVTSIGESAFSSCTSLTSIEIPNRVTSISKFAFDHCSKLNSVTIPSSVTSVGERAFSYCYNLKDVYCYAENVPITSSSAFQEVTLNSVKLYVLDSSKDDYNASAPWSGFGTIESLKANATLGTNGFTTFAYRYPLDLSNAKLPTGVKAYKASSISGTTVYFTEFDQTVPANTGILLEGPVSETVGILVAASGTDVASNEFHVNETGETFAAEPGYTYYALIKNSDPLTFGTFAPASVAMPSNKAYLMVAGGGNSARSMRTVFGSGITGLNETKSALDTTVKNGAYLEKGRIVIYKAGNKFNATGAQIK